MDCYFCTNCGTRVFHRIRDSDGKGRPTIIIKGGIIEGLSFASAKHIYTGTAVMPIPPGVESWAEAPTKYTEDIPEHVVGESKI
jgi:hypothetical protein